MLKDRDWPVGGYKARIYGPCVNPFFSNIFYKYNFLQIYLFNIRPDMILVSGTSLVKN